MKTLRSLDSCAAGLAIFSMFFGAGNIIFPLALGHDALDKTGYAISGLLLTAILIPFSGLFAMFLYQGDTKRFFSRIGQAPGLALAFLIISLLGPLGSTPRCIALAYSTCKMAFPALSAIWFSACACLIIFALACKKNRLLNLLGYGLTPILVGLLGFIIVKGLIEAPNSSAIAVDASGLELFIHGLKEGYNTMDLLAAFFFAPLVLSSIKKKAGEDRSNAFLFQFVLKASLIGASLLALVYLSFSYLAFYYASHLEGVANEQLLATVAFHVLGPYAGWVAGLIVILACLTTAIALIASFTSFVHQEILGKKIKEKSVLIGGLLLTFLISTFEFQGISRFLSPILEMCYPALILLTAFNISHELYALKTVKQLDENFE